MKLGLLGGVEQVLRLNPEKEEKEKEANRNHKVPVFSCNLT
jgi:hypothetical protein